MLFIGNKCYLNFLHHYYIIDGPLMGDTFWVLCQGHMKTHRQLVFQVEEFFINLAVRSEILED